MHGFFASPFWLNSAFFALPWFYSQGYDVMRFVMPFHGARQERHSPFSGAGLAMHGFSHFNEVIAQAVTDFRVLLNYVQQRGAPSVALTGISLGGYMSALLATLEPDLGTVIPNAPVADFMQIFHSWAPMAQVISAGMLLTGIKEQEFADAIAFHSPLGRKPVVSKEKLMIIGGLGDRLAPPAHARKLWEHWDRPRLHWYPGNHTLHVNRGAYLREMRRFMSDNGVVYTR
jgi:pimeloyl-ACP methyl ester carboxylesterase